MLTHNLDWARQAYKKNDIHAMQRAHGSGRGESHQNEQGQYIKSMIYGGLDGIVTTFAVVTAETLRKAQKHPEQYRDLIVRVAGYSAYFVDLTDELQEEIIRRTEQEI